MTPFFRGAWTDWVMGSLNNDPNVQNCAAMTSKYSMLLDQNNLGVLKLITSRSNILEPRFFYWARNVTSDMTPFNSFAEEKWLLCFEPNLRLRIIFLYSIKYFERKQEYVTLSLFAICRRLSPWVIIQKKKTPQTLLF